MRRALIVLLLLGCLAPSARAQHAPATLAELVESAGTILVGRVLKVREEPHPQYPFLTITRVTLAVERAFKGSLEGDSFTFLQIGGSKTFRPFHLPSYREGEEVMLFLYPKSRYGLTSPVAGMAGKFRLFRDPQTKRRMAVNGFDNRGLFDDSSARLALSSAERALVSRHEHGPIEYEVLAALIARGANASR
ncbi:MAG: hypothetical protein N0A16_03210 [Blastocatellia bacterium]|nr:hypothetical protein [Blastocatellia bacterium]MCS7156724.1 hypothetical protein [Blastocatellia bacterium]MCX7751534.1 hypothetical protein [Blastocatellia bacterium]MDW8168634.1 hypothetical protein [Acidobacteriota bacterium]MDW8256529.1 hypothetical protein [Acidobacteriota bacterium]